VTTLPGRLLLGLDARRRAHGGPIALVPCDNVPANGAGLRTSLLARAADIDDSLAEWIADNVSFVSTVVDRITPASTPDDRIAARELTGYDDRTPVVTEPFHDWILQDRFPVGRPPWEAAGARFAASIEPFEQRKLRMLNGAHTLLACVGLVRGHSTVAEAIADPAILRLVDRYWDEAARTLAPETRPDRYRVDLRARFANPRMGHTLAQISTDSLQKVRLRILPVLRAEVEAGRSGDAAKAAIAAWLDFQEWQGTTLTRRQRLAALDEQLAASL
jgi:fructuronate reductase